MKLAIHVLGALLLVPVAIGNFVGGIAAAEYYSGRKLYGFLEGDWFFLFGFIGAGACLAVALDTARRAIRRSSSAHNDSADRRC